MAIPDEIRSQVELALNQYSRGKVPAQLAGKLRLGYTFRGNSATMFEERPGLFDESEWVRIVVAQFRYDPPTGSWSLYCADRNSRWHLYDDIDPTKDFGLLLHEVEDDPTGIIWG